MFNQFSESRAKKTASTGVHQYQMVAGVDQIAVNGRVERGREEVIRQGVMHVFFGGVQQQFVHRQLDGAIGQGGDFEVAEHGAVIARSLLFYHRGLRLGGGRKQNTGCQAGNASQHGRHT